MVGATPGAVGGFAGGSLSVMGTSLLNGESFGSSLYAGAVSGLTSAAGSAIIGGISGAIVQSQNNRVIEEFKEFIAELERGDLMAFTSGNFSYEDLIDISSPDDKEALMALWKVYKKAKIATLPDPDGFPNKNRMDRLIDIDAVRGSSAWEQNGIFKEIYKRTLNYKGLEIKATIRLNDNLSIIDVLPSERLHSIRLMSDAPGRYYGSYTGRALVFPKSVYPVYYNYFYRGQPMK